MKQYYNNNVTAIILIAGKGRRLYPITNLFPKCLLQFHSISILERQIEALTSYNTRHIIFCLGYKRKMIDKELKRLIKKYHFTYSIILNRRFLNTNTLYSLYLCLRKMKTDSLLLNGDVLFDKGILGYLLDQLSQDKPLLAIEKKTTDSEEVKVALHKNYIYKISKEIQRNESEGEFTGIAFFPRSYTIILLKTLKQLVKANKVTQFFEYALQNTIEKYQAKLVPININDCRFIEIDTYGDYITAKKLF